MAFDIRMGPERKNEAGKVRRWQSSWQALSMQPRLL
jgi:hypothetical protein